MAGTIQYTIAGEPSRTNIVGEDHPLPVNPGALSKDVDQVTTFPGGQTKVFNIRNVTVATAHSPNVYGDTFEDVYQINSILGRNATNLIVTCGGPGALLVAISSDGSTSALTDGTYGTLFEIRPNESLEIRNISIHDIKVDANANGTEYRLIAW